MGDVKMYFKGGLGMLDPVDINGAVIRAGDILTTDYGDYEDYMHKPIAEHRKHEAFYLVEQGEGFLFAQSIKECAFGVMGGRFYLHDFRFKHCKKIQE